MRATVLELDNLRQPTHVVPDGRATVRLTPCGLARLLGARVQLVDLVTTERNPTARSVGDRRRPGATCAT